MSPIVCAPRPPTLYHLATGALNIDPADCLYVGDGGSNELTGAEAAGMTAVKILDQGGENHRFDTDDWHGPQIATPSAVLTVTFRASSFTERRNSGDGHL